MRIDFLQFLGIEEQRTSNQKPQTAKIANSFIWILVFEPLPLPSQNKK